MLALNEDDETSAEAPIDWKVLILDEPCRELLAPLVSVNELRARGVTLHAPIESPRDALGDVAAVYLCRPSAANAARIAKDAAQALYGALHCNWSRRAERKVLEGFARELAAAPPREGLPAAEDLVRSVWDRHVDFVALEPRLFHLRLQRRLKEVCGAGLAAPERVLEEVAEEVAAGLFCACAAVGAAGPSCARAARGCARGRGQAARPAPRRVAAPRRRRGAGAADGRRAAARRAPRRPTTSRRAAAPRRDVPGAGDGRAGPPGRAPRPSSTTRREDRGFARRRGRLLRATRRGLPRRHLRRGAGLPLAQPARARTRCGRGAAARPTASRRRSASCRACWSGRSGWSCTRPCSAPS